MPANPIPITVLTGYLGSGKTTVVNYVLNNQEGLKVAVITNDIGEVNIDSKLIEKGTMVSKSEESLIALSNGCICCTLRADLIEQVTELSNDGRFDYILIEASGVCEPLPIAQTLSMMDEAQNSGILPNVCRLDTMATVVDAYRLTTEFMGVDGLREETSEDDIVNLIIEQIEFCDLIILNKTDLVDPENLLAVKAIIKKLQPEASIIETSYGKVDPALILNAYRFDFDIASQSPGWLRELEKAQDGFEDEDESDEYGISSFVYENRKPFNYDRFISSFDNWPISIVRCKGFTWFSNDDSLCFLVEQAGKSVSIAPYGDWLASAPLEDQNEAFLDDPEILEAWDEEYGDRMTLLVFIGIGMDRERIEGLLDLCLD